MGGGRDQSGGSGGSDKTMVLMKKLLRQFLTQNLVCAVNVPNGEELWGQKKHLGSTRLLWVPEV